MSAGRIVERLRREKQTILVMARIYCHDQHRTIAGLCPECAELMNYAAERLDRCIYQENKPTCANCPIHCYRKDRREQIRIVMRYAGRRMLFKHPILAILHLLDGRRKAPQIPPKHGSGRIK